MKNGPAKIQTDKEIALHILNGAATVYQNLAISEGNNFFQKYIKDHRYTQDSISLFKIGIASNENSILENLIANSSEIEINRKITIAITIGLIHPDKNNPRMLADTFRDRIMLPLCNYQGEVVGFTSKAINDNANARFMNSVESDIFAKKDLLYGYHLAAEDIKKNDYVIISSGILHSIILRQNGINNGIGLRGIGLSDEAVNQLLSLTKNIYLTSDELKNARIGEQLLERKANVKILSLDNNLGPAGYIWENGLPKFLEKIESAKSYSINSWASKNIH